MYIFTVFVDLSTLIIRTVCPVFAADGSVMLIDVFAVPDANITESVEVIT